MAHNNQAPGEAEALDISLHTLMTDSAPSLLDWVLYHRHIGFWNITVHGDAANAQATMLAQTMADAGLITFLPTKDPGLAHARTREIRAQALALDTETAQGRDYLLWLQPDDYLVVDTGQGKLADLVAGLGEMPDMLSLTCMPAGSSGHNRFVDQPVTDRFTKGAGGGQGPLPFHSPIRTIFRPDMARQLSTARPKVKPKYARGKADATWLNCAGQDVADQYMSKGWTATPEMPGLGFAHVMSFMTLDRESYILRRTGSESVLPFMTVEHVREMLQQFYRLNVSLAEMGPLGANPPDLLNMRAAAFAEHPQIAATHAEVVAEFSGRMARLMEKQDPIAVQIMDVFLAGRNPPLRGYQWAVPAGVIATRSSLSEADSAWAEKLTRTDSSDESDQDDWAEPENDAESETAEKPTKNDTDLIESPEWLNDLRLSGNAYGFYHSMPNYACTYVARGRENLMISFDNLASVRENPVNRLPWGYGFIRKANWSHLGVLSFVPGWFRDENLHNYLKSLRDSGFFRRFDQITLFGTSMGGYGAAAFASLVPGCRVAAFSPQSSLAPNVAGWDQRYPTGRRMNWAGEFSDAPTQVFEADQVWIFYDPDMENDRRHAERFTTPNVRHVPLRYSDHKTALMLRNGGILSSVMRNIVNGEATVNSLLRAYRACRNQPAYIKGLKARAEKTGGAKRLALVERILASQSEMAQAD